MTTPFLKNSTIKSKLDKLHRSRHNLKIAFDREMRKLDNQVSDTQARCEHSDVLEIHKTDYQGYYAECRVCGLTSFDSRILPEPIRAKEVQKLQSAPRV